MYVCIEVYIYTGTDACVYMCRKQKEKKMDGRMQTKFSLSLSPLPFFHSFIFECQSARLCVYKCV